MIEMISLTSYMRDLLLEEICSRMDIIEYCKYFYHLTFTQSLKDTYTGDCPFCRARNSFAINKVTGKSYCLACGKERDFLALMSKRDGRDLNGTLQVLTGYLEAKKEAKPAYSGGAL